MFEVMLQGFAHTQPDWAHPGPNQDSFVLNLPCGVAAVFDGLAGHGDGHIASSLAARAVDGAAHHGLAARELLEHARELLQAARAKAQNPQMTCTAMIARVQPDGSWEAAWCGDSRAYVICPDGRVVRASYDHDIIYQRQADSLVSPQAAERARIAAEEAQTPSDAWRLGGPLAKQALKRRHVMVSELAHGPVGMTRGTLAGGELLVLTTDGVHDNMPRSVLQRVATDAAPEGPLAVVEALVAEAMRRAKAGEGLARPDDITCVCVGQLRADS